MISKSFLNEEEKIILQLNERVERMVVSSRYKPLVDLAFCIFWSVKCYQVKVGGF